MARKKAQPKDEPRIIEHGSIEHAAMLGLLEDKDSELGWQLADITLFGPHATPEFLERVLLQKVRELTQFDKQFIILRTP